MGAPAPRPGVTEGVAPARPLRVIHTLASVASEASGPAYTAPRLTSELAQQGADAALMTVGDPLTNDIMGVPHQCFAPSDAAIPGLRAFERSATLGATLNAEAMTADILHTHGLWLHANMAPAFATRRPGARTRLVISPRGMLGRDALQFSRWKKKAALLLGQRRALDTAALFHATAESEYDDIRQFGLTAPVAIIPNGIDVPEAPPSGAPREREILSLGRVHPKKGLDRLIRAWGLIAADFPDWRLRLVGPAEGGYDRELRHLVETLSVPRVHLDGPLFGDAKKAAYERAAVFALATLHENFAMTVAEALAAETPVISTKGAPWAGLETHECGWWIDHGPEAMAAALRDALCRPDAVRAAMGAKGRAWMLRDFGWSRIGRDMLDAYRWVIEGGTPPETVRLA